jgi:hypothetical protein
MVHHFGVQIKLPSVNALDFSPARVTTNLPHGGLPTEDTSWHIGHCCAPRQAPILPRHRTSRSKSGLRRMFRRDGTIFIRLDRMADTAVVSEIFEQQR